MSYKKNRNPNRATPVIKRYFNITELAELLGVNHASIRHWEQEFNIPIAKRKGNRIYNLKKVAVITEIKKLSDTGDYTLMGIFRKMYNEGQLNSYKWIST